MKIVSGDFLFTLCVLLDLNVLSSQSEFLPPEEPLPIQTIRYYELQNGTLQHLNRDYDGHLVYNTNFVYGLYLNGILHPLCDADGRRVVRRRSDGQTIPIPSEVAAQCGFNRPPWNRRRNSRASGSPS